MPKPIVGTYPAFAANYVNLVDADSVQEAVTKYSDELNTFFRSIPAEKVESAYAEGKWTIKELLQHVIDTERIFAYRAVCIARKDQTSFPGFDENVYAANSKANKRDWQELLQEFDFTRKSTDILMLSFDEEQLQQAGITNNSPNNVNAICFTLIGHVLHHKKIIEERYLN
jgi:uncharacterized damage-inducible protein DinB